MRMAVERAPLWAGRLLAAMFLLAVLANLSRFVLKYLPRLGYQDWLAMSAYLGLLALVLWICRRQTSPVRESQIAGGLLAASWVGKTVLACWLSGIPQTADRGFLLQFIDRWAAGGAAALPVLSREFFDYPLWAGRAWPFLYPLRLLFPERFVPATFCLNAFLSTLLAGGIYLVLRPYVRRPLVPLGLAVLSPALVWQVAEYGYQFQGALLLLAALFVLGRLSQALAGSSRFAWLWLAALALAYFLLFLQRGLELVLLAVGLALAVYEALAARSWRRLLRGGLAYAVVPLLLVHPAEKRVDGYFRQYDEGRLSSHFIGHMAMGWNLETWGEYYGPVVALDRRTPPERKTAVMLGYVAEQVRARPFDALVKLPLVKLVKLFQLGAASGAEDDLRAAGARAWWTAARATRLVFAPLALGLAALGAAGFFGRNGRAVFPWALLVLAFVAAYTFFSETSPRYSFYFQFVVLACAAEGLETLFGRRPAA